MISASLDDTGYTGMIILKPSLSLSWKANLRFYLTLCILSLSIASVFLLQGRWLVLPFTVIALIVLGASLYVFFCSHSRSEVIRFNEREVIIERGRYTAESTIKYPRQWSEFYIAGESAGEAADKNSAFEATEQMFNGSLHSAIPIITIKSREQETELGAFLGYEEKIQLIQLLKKITQQFSQAFQYSTKQAKT